MSRKRNCEWNLVDDSDELPEIDAIVNVQKNKLVKDESGCSENVNGGLHYEDCNGEGTIRYTLQGVKTLSEPQTSSFVIIRCFPWQILVIPKIQVLDSQTHSHLGFFVNCCGDCMADSTWSVFATIHLKLLHIKDPSLNYVRVVHHLFNTNESDWGYSSFKSMSEILDEKNGFYNAETDSIYLEAHICADVPRGIPFLKWDSRKLTGYVGLQNQGATCYLNSLLQVLYFTNKFRKCILQIPTPEGNAKNLIYALQKVFYDLETSSTSVNTRRLTASFGWDSGESLLQHDAQEFCRVLLDNLEMKLVGTRSEGMIQQIFKGFTSSFIRCKHVAHESRKTESFYDLQLKVRGNKTIYDSFEDFVSTETLTGENKYDAGKYGLQEADKGTMISVFPPVLHLHLMRFQFDSVLSQNVKINDRLEFTETLDLGKYLDSQATPQTVIYKLHAVLVHSGDNHGGHYVAYINPEIRGQWYKFDDDLVSTCSRVEAIDNNFGGIAFDDSNPIRRNPCAYMLVYVRDIAIDDVLLPVSLDDIPAPILERLSNDNATDPYNYDDHLNEAFVTYALILEEDLYLNEGCDLIPNRINRFLKIKKDASIKDVMSVIALALKVGMSKIRLWPIIMRSNGTLRPATAVCGHNNCDNQELKQLLFRSETARNMFYVEVQSASVDLPLPSFNAKSQVVIFLKYYDPETETIAYKGYIYLGISLLVYEVMREICKKVNFDPDTPLLLFEEVKPTIIEPILKLSSHLEDAFEELMDGDIIIFQKKVRDLNTYRFPTAVEFFSDFTQRIELHFYNRNEPNVLVFSLVVSLRMAVHELFLIVSHRLGVNVSRLQLFSDSVTVPVIDSTKITLREIFCTTCYYEKKMLFEKLNINVDEMKDRLCFKCTYMRCRCLVEKLIHLYPPKNGFVSNLFDEFRKCVTLSKEAVKLRLLEISNSKILRIVETTCSLSTLDRSQRSYRIEEVSEEDTIRSPNEILIPVAHFSNEILQTYGSPFLIKVTQDEVIGDVKKRIQQKLEISDKEFEKFKFVFVRGSQPTYLTADDDARKVSLHEYRSIDAICSRLWLGIDHCKRKKRGTRMQHVEKSVKIFN